MFKTVFGNRPSQKIPAMQSTDGNLRRSGKFNRRQVRRILAPVNRADDAKIVVERNHHARQRREREAIVAVIVP